MNELEIEKHFTVAFTRSQTQNNNVENKLPLTVKRADTRLSFC